MKQKPLFLLPKKTVYKTEVKVYSMKQAALKPQVQKSTKYTNSQ